MNKPIVATCPEFSFLMWRFLKSKDRTVQLYPGMIMLDRTAWNIQIGVLIGRQIRADDFPIIAPVGRFVYILRTVIYYFRVVLGDPDGRIPLETIFDIPACLPIVHLRIGVDSF